MVSCFSSASIQIKTDLESYVWDPSKESIVPNRASREVGLEAGGKAGLAAGKPAIKAAGKYASKRGYLCSSVPTQVRLY